MKYNKIKLTKIFNIVSPINDDKINFELCDSKDKNAIPFLGRSAKNNGIVSWTKPRKNFLNKGNKITVALDGSSGSTFYQEFDFHSGQNIWLLEPKNFKLNKKVGLFLVTVLSKTFKDYTYALGLTKNRLQNIELLLPIKNKKLDIVSIEKYTSSYKVANLSSKKLKINIPKKMKYVPVEKIFTYIKNAKSHRQSSLEQNSFRTKEYDIPFVSAKKENNGIAFFTKNNSDLTLESNCITISNNGSVGYASWRPYKFISNSDVTILKTNKFKLNKKIALFLCSSIQKAAKPFSYGNKLKGEKLKKLEILVPINKNNAIDIEAMENWV